MNVEDIKPKISKGLRTTGVCTKCGNVIISTHVHDWVACECGDSFVDGGAEYIRYGGDNLVLLAGSK